MLSRRIAFMGIAFLSALSPRSSPAAEVGVTDTEIRIGASMGQSGPLAPMAKVLEAGAHLYFDKINASGGVHGRRIRYVLLDDGYDVTRAVDNTQKLINEQQVFAIYANSGSAHTAAILPLIDKTQTVLFGPITGAPAFRRQQRPTVFHVRASYRDEIERIVAHASTIGATRIALFCQNDGLGKIVLAELEETLRGRQLSLAAVAKVEMKDSDYKAAARALAQSRPQVIVMGALSKYFTEFVKAYRAEGGTLPQLYGLSTMEPELIASELGEAGRGIALAQIMPSVRNFTLPVVREYRAALAERRPGATPTTLELDAYVTAKVFVEGLRRAGRNLTRPSFVGALEGMGRYDVGGFAVTYTPKNHNGATFVDLATVDWRGKLQY